MKDLNNYILYFFRVICFGVAVCMTGCVDIVGPDPQPVATNDIFTDFSFTTDAMFIRQDDTLQVAVQAFAINQSVIPINTKNVRWSSEDSSRVYIDTLGQLIGRSVGQLPVVVEARYTHGAVTRTAYMDVYVTAGAFSATSVKMTLLDSARVGANGGSQLPRVQVNLYDNNTIVQSDLRLPIKVPSPLFTSYSPEGGPDKTPAYSIGSSGGYFGRFPVKVSINLYGVEVHDSLEFTGIYPYQIASLFVGDDTDGGVTGLEEELQLAVQPCAVIPIVVTVTRPIDLVFSDSLAPSTGCDSLPSAALASLPGSTQYVGGNVTNILPDGFQVIIRRSNTEGRIEIYVRDHITKEKLKDGPVINSIHVD